MEIRRGDIFEVDLGEYRGSIQGGYRPCVIVQNDIGNKYSPVTIVYPLTAKVNSKKIYLRTLSLKVLKRINLQ